jgi:hypothetical protein
MAPAAGGRFAARAGLVSTAAKGSVWLAIGHPGAAREIVRDAFETRII